jgi:hypothetical protein
VLRSIGFFTYKGFDSINVLGIFITFVVHFYEIQMKRFVLELIDYSNARPAAGAFQTLACESFCYENSYSLIAQTADREMTLRFGSLSQNMNCSY